MDHKLPVARADYSAVLLKSKRLSQITSKILGDRGVIAQHFDQIPFISYGHEGYVTSVAITPDGKHIISGSWDKTIKIWDLHSGACINTLEGHKDYVRSVAISPNGKHIISGGDDGTIRIWDLHSGSCINTLEGLDYCREYGYSVRSIAITPDGKHIVSGSGDGTIRIWEMHSGECVNILEEHDYPVRSVAITPDGKHIVSGSDDGTIGICEMQSGVRVNTFGEDNYYYDEDDHQHNIEDDYHVRSVAITPDGKHIVSGGQYMFGYEDTIKIWEIQIWEIQSGECVNTLERHDFSVNSVAITPDGKHIISGSWDKTIKIWDLHSGACINTLEGHNDSVDSVAVSPDGKYIVSGSMDKTMKFWDIQGGKLIYTTFSFLDNQTITINPNGYFVASDEAIDSHLYMHTSPMGARKLTQEEIKHFRRANLLEI